MTASFKLSLPLFKPPAPFTCQINLSLPALSKTESGTVIGNFEEIRFRRPTSAQLSRAVKAELSAY